ncbi:MAG: 3-phosphoserine/phosphohydroxythreonine transaminase [Candidatus Wallbacteria bacterium]|nr:3-phosphoserine/phosphohydroxythreonine transaminase [Candidatus Wallbacteria bacterium]
MTNRIFNFSAGPAVLPLPVLEQAQRDLIALPGVGMSILEISHRSAPFEQVIQTAEKNLRSLLGVPEDYAVLFLQGGATLQFAMVPMNLLPAGASADYVLTGSWGQSAFKEAKKFGTVRVACSTESDNFSRIPRQEELSADPKAAYLHYTSNETIHGTEFDYTPAAPAGVPLVCDSSSDFLSRPIDVARHGLIYAGAQKNAGPAGVTVVIVRKDLLGRAPASTPVMLDYAAMAKAGSLHNTPPCFSIYVVGLVLEWLVGLGGLEAVARRNREKAKLLYDAIDSSGGFYRGHSRPECRSLMNVTFRLPTEELEKKFAKESTAAGLDGLKGHRSVGGLRASIYNAFPIEGVARLVEFMQDFRQKNG